MQKDKGIVYKKNKFKSRGGAKLQPIYPDALRFPIPFLRFNQKKIGQEYYF
jgi:hypothetical protein